MSFTTAEYIQGLLLEIQDFNDRIRLPKPRDNDLDRRVEAIRRLFRLADSIDVAIRGFAYVDKGDLDQIPPWLIEGRSGANPFGGLVSLLNRLQDPADLGEALEYFQQLDDERDALKVFRDLMSAVGPIVERDGHLILAAAKGSADSKSRNQVLVPTTLREQEPGVLLRLTPYPAPGRSTELTHHQLSPRIALEIEEEEPWQADFLEGIRNGVRAADSLLRSLNVAEPSNVGFAVAGVLSRPSIRQSSAALPVALARIAAAFPRELTSSRDLVATGVIRHQHESYVIDPMDETTVKAKLAVAQVGRLGKPDSQNRFDWLLAPADREIAGVQRFHACTHSADRVLRDAARAVWTSQWVLLEERLLKAKAKKLQLSRIVERESPLIIDGIRFVFPTRLQTNIAGHYQGVLGAKDQEFRATWGVIGGRPNSGRTWTALGVAEILESDGWHVVVYSTTDPLAELPDPYQLLDLCELQFPKNCHRNLLILDDLNYAEGTSRDILRDFASVLNDANVHLLLVVGGTSGRSSNVGGKWDTTHAPFTSGSLDRIECDAIVECAARRLDQPIELVEGRSLLARLHWLSVHSRGRALLDREELARVGPHDGAAMAHVVCATLCLLRLGVRSSFAQQYVATNELRPLKRLAVFEANAILDRLLLPGTGDRRTTMAYGLLTYIEWLLAKKYLSDVAAIFNRLQNEHSGYLRSVLLGRSRVGRLDWGLIESALRTADYYGVARLTKALQQTRIPRDRRATMANKLALSILDGINEIEDVGKLSWALQVLWENRSVVDRTLLDDVRHSLNAVRISEALRHTPRIAGRWYLVRTLARILDTERGASSDIRILDILERCHNDLFVTDRPDYGPELGAALRLHDEVERARRAWRPREHLAADHAWIDDLLTQIPDETWPLDARLALYALQERFSTERLDVVDIATSIVRSAADWSIFQLNRGLAYLRASSPRLAEGVAFYALRNGLGTVLRSRLTMVPPAVAAEILFFLLRLAPAEVLDVYYELAPDGLVPRREIVESTVTQIRKFPDYKGVSRLFSAFASQDREADATFVHVGQAVFDGLPRDYVPIALRAARRSVSQHLINAIFDSDVSIDPSLGDEVLREVLDLMPDGTVDNVHLASTLLTMMSAEDSGQLRLSDGRTVIDSVLSAISVQDLDIAMIRSWHSDLLEVTARLAAHIETITERSPDRWAARRYAQAFRVDEAQCLLCATARVSDPQEMLDTATVMVSILRRGGRTDALEAVQGVLRSHWQLHSFPGVPFIRLHAPGVLRNMLLTARTLHMPVLLDRIDNEQLRRHIIEAGAFECAEILIHLHRLARDRSEELRSECESMDETGRVYDKLLMQEYGPRSRFSAFRMMEQSGWKPDRERLDRIKIEAVAVAGSTRSLLQLSDALRTVARFDSPLASSIARRRATELAGTFRVRGRERGRIVPLAGIFQALFAQRGAQFLISRLLDSGAHLALSLREQAGLFDRVSDVSRDDIGFLREQLNDSLANAAGTEAVHGTDRLADMGRLGSRLADHDLSPVQLAKQPVVADGCEGGPETVWGLGFVTFPGWDNYWERAVDRFEISSVFTPEIAAGVLSAFAFRGQLERIGEGVADDLFQRAAMAPFGTLRVLSRMLEINASVLPAASLRRCRATWRSRLNDPWQSADPDGASLRKLIAMAERD